MKRDVQNKMIAGVCAGVANSMGFSHTSVRLIFVGSILLFGIGFLAATIAYGVLFVIMPVEN